MADDPEAPDTDNIEEPVDGDDIEDDPSRNPPDEELNDLRGA
jgi:hypothetical protein